MPRWPSITLVPIAERLDAKTCYEPNTGCWLWLGAKDSKGYGHIWVDGRLRGVHVVTYELEVGPVPDGLDLDHLCRVPQCRSPYHLEPVTRRENVLRGISPTAEHARQASCLRGHPFTEENTYRWRGGRICRACGRAKDARARQARREAV